MGCKLTRTEPYEEENDKKKKRSRNKKRRKKHKERSHRHHQSQDEIIDNDRLSDKSSVKDEQEVIIEIRPDEDTASEHSAIVDEFVDIIIDDPQAFNNSFIQQRQQAINNNSYRSIIESWNPNSLQQLADAMKSLGNGKSLVDRHWIIFYWVAHNIEYDTVSYFSKDYKDQSAEGVFRTKKGVCAGYANIYKHLCDELEMPCEVVSGYSKGYGFDDREGAPPEVDHAWNAVEIYHHWYLMESTWGAGHLDDNKQFKRELTAYYFLPRPNEMIYHHLPEDEKWQLLQTPIQMIQYMQMPKLRPDYFEYNLEIIQPINQSYVNFEQDKAFALVIIKTPTDVYLTAGLKLHDKIIEGGDRVIFDKRKRLWFCYFAPATSGKHKVVIYAKRGDSDIGKFSGVLDLAFNVKEMPENPMSFPKTWRPYFDLGLKLLSPLRTHLIHIGNDEKFTQIFIRTPPDVLLLGQLQNHRKEDVICGDRVYYDREKDFWRCKFAPNENGIFDANILAKRKTDPGSYTSAISFKINANQISLPPFSFPKTWQLFYDLRLQIQSPAGRGIIVLKDKTPFAEIRIKAPQDVDLLGQLQTDKNEEVPKGAQIYYDNEKDFWRCRFEPNRKGMFDAVILAKKKSDSGSYTSAVSFKIDVKQFANQRESLLDTTQLFHDLKIKVVSPVGRNKIILPEKSSFAEITVKTPDDVELLGQLKNSNNEKIPDSNQVYYDRHKDIWHCKFAPNQNGIFDAVILAKKKSDPDFYSGVVTFEIEANHIQSPPLTFPKTWQTFFDYDLKIEAPRSRSTALWSENASYTEILVHAPDDTSLSCRLEYNDVPIENGSLAQYDYEKNLWQLLFAPEKPGLHKLTIFAKQIKDDKPSTSVAMFTLNVTKIRRPMKFPMTYREFDTRRCQIHTPLDGTLKKNSSVPIHCVIPGATNVSLAIDSKPPRSEGYTDPILKRDITVGSEQVLIYAKYGQNPHYTTLIKYSVE